MSNNAFFQTIVRPQVARLMSSSVLRLLMSASIVTVGARLIQLLLATYLVRAIGATGYGLYAYVYGLSLLIRQFSGMGWPETMARYVPSYLHRNQLGELKGFLRTGLIIMVGTTIVASAVLLALLHWDMALFSEPVGLYFVALQIIPGGILIENSRQIIARQMPGRGNFWELAFPPFLTLAVVVLFFSRAELTPEKVLYVYVIATGLAALLSAFDIRRLKSAEEKAAPALYEMREWMIVTVPIMFSKGLRNVVNRIDVVLLAPLVGLTEVGYYALAVQISYVLTFPQMVLNSVMAPIFARSFADKRYAQLKRVIMRSIGFSFLTATPPALAFLLFPEWFMTTVGGPEYSEATGAFVWLTVAQFIAAPLAPITTVLVACAGEYRLLVANAIALIINIALNLTLIPTMGAEGAGIARAVSMAVTILLVAYSVWKLLHTLKEEE